MASSDVKGSAGSALLICSFYQAPASCCHQHVTLIPLHAQLWTDSSNASTIQSRSSMHSVYSRNKTNNAFKEEEVTAHFQGRHDVFIHCFHHFLQTTVRTHWLILLASYFEFKTKNIMKHLFSTNVHSIIHTNGCM